MQATLFPGHFIVQILEQECLLQGDAHGLVHHSRAPRGCGKDRWQNTFIWVQRRLGLQASHDQHVLEVQRLQHAQFSLRNTELH